MTNVDTFRLLADDARKRRKEYEQKQIDQFRGQLEQELTQQVVDVLELTFAYDDNRNMSIASFSVPAIADRPCMLWYDAERNLVFQSGNVIEPKHTFTAIEGLSTSDQLVLYIDKLINAKSNRGMPHS